MALTTVDQLTLALKQALPHSKIAATAAQSVGSWFFGWLQAGRPAAGAVPSSGVGGNTVDSTTTGAIPFTNPASGLTYLAGMSFGTSISGVLYLYDRLWHNSGLSPTLTTSQTVSSVTLPSRCPVLTDPTGRTFDALGNTVEAWLDVTTVMGAGTVAPTISYTDEAGNAGSTATLQQWITAGAANRAFPFDRAAGDRGVRSIQSYQQTATQTSGAFSLVLRRRLAMLPVTAKELSSLNWGLLGAVIPDSACLELLYQPDNTNAVGCSGTLLIAQG
jgi:hypothetical protein